MALALYRKYRSRKLADVVGQNHVTDILKRALENDKIAHAYLFTGPRGVGKTSIARILAHEINELPYDSETNHLDIVEIDAASNNGVDDIRELREKVQLAPSSAKRKVYIIDEVHMLSKPAFNALLKTLEEPPSHVVLILATTDVDKLPVTIISRTQRHTFKAASIDDIIKNLTNIAEQEAIKIDTEALELIAEHSDGSYRDSVSLLDQLSNTASSGEPITKTLVEQNLGLAQSTYIDSLLKAVDGHDFDAILSTLRELESNGVQAKIIASQLIREISKHLAKHPTRYGMLDGLIDVSQSSLPSAKLLAVLGEATNGGTQPATKATAVAVKEPVVEIEILAKKATEPHPKDDIVQPETTPVAPSKKEVTKPAEQPTVETPTPKPKKRGPKNIVAMNWDGLITSSKELSIALHSVLSKCSHETDSNILTIYCKNEFYKKKLDTPKFKQHIQTILDSQTNCEWEIVTIPGNKPSDDSQVAAIAAMMGGGEEIKL